MDWASMLNSATNLIGSGQTAPATTIVGGSAMGGGAGGAAMGVFPTIARGAAMLSAPLIAAIGKLAARLGFSGTSPLAFARKSYGMLAAWSAKNPGVSLIALLVNLGLTAEEAAHFIGWGATHKKRRRARGITGRDLKTTRRTIRKVTSMARALSAMCSSVPHARHRRAARA